MAELQPGRISTAVYYLPRKPSLGLPAYRDHFRYPGSLVYSGVVNCRVVIPKLRVAMWRGCMAPVKTPRRRGGGPALRARHRLKHPCGAHQPRPEPVALSCGACRRACPALGYQSGAAAGLFRSRIRYSQRRPIARASNGVGCRHRPLRRPVARHGGALALGARGARAGHLVARANLPRFRIRLKLPCALKGSYYQEKADLGDPRWRPRHAAA